MSVESTTGRGLHHAMSGTIPTSGRLHSVHVHSWYRQSRFLRPRISSTPRLLQKSVAAPPFAFGKTSSPQASPNNKESSTSSQDDQEDTSSRAKIMASLSVVGGLVLLVLGGVLMKDQIADFLDLFIHLVDTWGPLGYLAYMIVYAVLEILAVPAIPLTMTAGAIFGVVPGTMVVSVAATVAATGAFLIARYVARDKVAKWADENPKFKAIDKAIGKNGFKVVTLLRMSPLLPLAASNYLYGLTSVDLGAYIGGSWLGMLPGTFAYVAAGTYSKELLTGGMEGGGGFAWWQIAAGLGATALAVFYVGRLATNALKEYEDGV